MQCCQQELACKQAWVCPSLMLSYWKVHQWQATARQHISVERYNVHLQVACMT